ncbi:cyclic AMP-dependent transcription factor ATF-2-like [Salvelinus alpinus]
MNGQLQNEVTLLRNEVDQLNYLLADKDCPVTAKKKKSAYHTSEEDSYEEMSIPDSLQSEAIQHSSVSISNGVSSSSMTPAVSALASAPIPTRAAQSTEEDQPQGGAALFTTQTQPSGS